MIGFVLLVDMYVIDITKIETLFNLSVSFKSTLYKNHDINFLSLKMMIQQRQIDHDHDFRDFYHQITFFLKIIRCIYNILFRQIYNIFIRRIYNILFRQIYNIFIRQIYNIFIQRIYNIFIRQIYNMLFRQIYNIFILCFS